MIDLSPAPHRVSIPTGRVAEITKALNRIETWAFRHRYIIAVPEGTVSALYFAQEHAARAFSKTFLK